VEEITKVYDLLHNELERLDKYEVEIEKVYLVRDDGEMIPIAEIYPQKAEDIIKSIKKSNSKTLSFVSVWQSVQVELAKHLNGSSMRVLCYIVGKMKFENLGFDITQREISENLNMSSRTVIRAIKQLEEVGVIAHSINKNRRVYHINPAYAWKGSFMKVKYRMSIFREAMKKYKKIWKRN
jgi:DNA-binding MarR family transcriptional regulator